MPRLLTSILVLVFTGAALAGCGGGGGSSAAGHPATGHAGVGQRSVSRNPSPAVAGPAAKAQAIAFAHAVNLTAADLSGFTGSPAKEDSLQSEAESAALLRCAGVAEWHPVAEVASPRFESGPEHEEQVMSTVTVMPTAALAEKDDAAIRSGRGEACIEKEIRQGLTRGHGSAYVSVSKVEEGSLEGPDVPGSFEFETSTDITVGEGGSAGAYMDLLGFTEGPVEVLLTVGDTSQPINPEAGQHLISLLFKRAQEQLHR
jgi:hypothetical protein